MTETFAAINYLPSEWTPRILFFRRPAQATRRVPKTTYSFWSFEEEPKSKWQNQFLRHIATSDDRSLEIATLANFDPQHYNDKLWSPKFHSKCRTPKLKCVKGEHSRKYIGTTWNKFIVSFSSVRPRFRLSLFRQFEALPRWRLFIRSVFRLIGEKELQRK